MLGIILAGGKGERLRPLTDHMPKVLIPVQGKALLEHVIELLKAAGVDEVVLSTGHMGDKVREHFANRDVGVKLSFLHETTPRGTAGPLLMLREAGRIPADDFYLINGDNLFSTDLRAMMACHRAHGGAATIGLHQVDDPSAYGVVRLEGDRIVEFVEKPARGQAPSTLINSGYAILSPAAFAYVPSKSVVMNEYDVYPALAKAGLLYGHRGEGQWFDTGTAERYLQVQREWRKPRKQ
ncbi:MAG: mannose-1-phosphate guanylyltransferase [Parcubacteria group bacterium Gr01-1014_31]|nr:MAG: mannose-1-phosphate guanylyltransferase [Parcubacteria group bacterium Gr01-1014_31]